MSAIMQEAVEMQTEDEVTQSGETQNAENGEQVSTEDAQSELNLSHWSVVSFEGVAVSGLNYEEASKWVEKLNNQKISGLCIVTDEAAARMVK